MDRYLPIPFNKTYFACSNGKIYNKRGKEIGCERSDGYSIVFIKDIETNKYKCIYVHRLIWLTFNGEIPEDYEIDHIIPLKNGGTNALSNLRLVTHKENCNNENSIENYKKSNIELPRGFGIPNEIKLKRKKVQK